MRLPLLDQFSAANNGPDTEKPQAVRKETKALINKSREAFSNRYFALLLVALLLLLVIIALGLLFIKLRVS